MYITTMTAIEIASAIKNREITAVDAAKAFLNEIKATDENVKAWILIDEDKVIENAQSIQEKINTMLDNGKKLPALAGVPVGIKDNICIKGTKTTCASKILENFVPTYNAGVIDNINENMMVVLGKTNMDEFAMGSSTEHSAYFKTYNPWNKDYVPGGSSGGSAAAVTASQAPITLGSDTGGSIRQPAGFCGVTGLKPTYGTVSRYGLVAFASSFDQIGPFAKDAASAAAMYDVIKGHDAKDSTSYDKEYESTLDAIDTFTKPTIGIPVEYMTDAISPKMKEAVLNAKAKFEKLGCKVVEVSIPVLSLALPAYYILSSAEASSNLQRFDGVRYGFRCLEPVDVEDLYKRTRSEGFGDEVKRRIMMGTFALCSGYYDEYFNKGLKARTKVVDGFNAAFSKVDLLLTPTAHSAAFKFGEKADAMSMYLTDLCTVSVNLAGLPGISFPGGFNEDNMPLGVQLIGPKFSESKLLSTVHAFQKETDYHKMSPSLKGGNN